MLKDFNSRTRDELSTAPFSALECEMKNMSVIIKCGLKFDLNCFDSFLMGSNLGENALVACWLIRCGQ